VTDYPCDSHIVQAVSAGADPGGPYTIERTLFGRSTWEPALARNPASGELVLMFFGNLSRAPPVGSAECLLPSESYNLTTTNTYITVSKSGSVHGPWSRPQMVKGMENRPHRTADPYSWHCASGNPSPAFHPNGTLFAAMRQNPCWKGFEIREHIGLWRADHGWDQEWTLVSAQPLYGWGGGSERNCTDQLGCPSHEDPHLWWDERGAHLLTHMQNNHQIHSVRGGYGWSRDGLAWTLETGPIDSNASAWPMAVKWRNGTSTKAVRRQRASLIRDPESGAPTHLLNGADFTAHRGLGSGGRVFCDGCHWGSGETLVVPLRR
jgi:hypothetical protein